VQGNAYFGTFNNSNKYLFEPFSNLAGGANNAYLASGQTNNGERSGFVFQARNSAGTQYNAVIFEGHNSTSTSTPLTIEATGAATFSSSVTTGADATINGVTVGKGAGNQLYNTTVGNGALNVNTSGTINTAVGFEAGNSNTSGAGNTNFGFQSGKGITTGNYNIGVGSETLGAAAGSYNVAIGRAALNVATGSNNTAVGGLALQNNTASNNTAVGFEAAYSNTEGVENSALGYRALRANTVGYTNTAIGYDSLLANTTGYTNTAIGRGAGKDNTTGFLNLIIGAEQLTGNYSLTTMIGLGDTATGSNQMRFGSAVIVNGAVTTEVNASTKVWNVFINGVAQKILLA